MQAPIVLRKRGSDEIDTYRKYYQTIEKNGELLKLINECKNMKKPCRLNTHVNLSQPDNFLNVSGEGPKHQHSDILYATKDAKLANTPARGQHLVADRKIKKYEVVIREPPTVLTMNPSCLCLSNENTIYRCHNCASAIVNFVKCKFCDLAIYCSNECLVEANNAYHMYECFGYQRHYWPMDFTDQSYIAMRMMFLGRDQFQNDETDEKGSRFSGDYGYIYNLSTNFEKIGMSKLNKILFRVTRTVVYLIEKTRFFLKWKNNLYNMYMYVGGLMLRHYCQAQANCIYVEFPNYSDSYGFDVIGSQGKAICPTVALLNHSCSPNCILVVCQDSIVVKTIKPIATNEELTICYYEVNPLWSYNERRDVTNFFHYFVCECVNCDIEEFNEDAPYKCYACSDGRMTAYTKKHKELAKCLKCSTTIDFSSFRTCLNMIEAAKKKEVTTSIDLKLIVELAPKLYPSDSSELTKELVYVCDAYFKLAEGPAIVDIKEDGIDKIVNNEVDVQNHQSEVGNKNIKCVNGVDMGKSKKKLGIKEEKLNPKNKKESYFNLVQLDCALKVYKIVDSKISPFNKCYLRTRLVFFENILGKPIVCDKFSTDSIAVLDEWSRQLEMVSEILAILVPPWNTHFNTLIEKSKIAAANVLYPNLTHSVLEYMPISHEKSRRKKK